MANQYANHILDPSNPYYMHPNENPGSALVSTLLNGHNYHPWSRAMTMTLETKYKFEFIDGSLKKLASLNPMHTAWKKCNNLVVSWLSHSIKPSIIQSVLWMDSARKIWDDFKKRYHEGDMLRISELIGEMHSIRQGSAYVDKFYTQMKGLWQQLDNYIPIPSCYHEIKFYASHQQSLFNTYPARRQICFEEPSFSGSISSNNYDNKSRGRGRGIIESVTARSNIQERSGPFARGRGHKICIYYQNTGHTIDTWYKKHGFPPSYFTNSTNINYYSRTESQINELAETEQAGSREEKLDPTCLFTPTQHNALKI
ncbi:PREDICTED: uncharacterized protein LOC109350474 [Lupinus angustifolius]|uniref:uncharacterized protein LOC109350474 n=1 Tax=Lupinus angustifolius TaxID=3871 RepID=UPI00092F7BEF|nr:PREDICTED: uncharacterized protein LOC109350474 [Lupinus angustifolius]